MKHKKILIAFFIILSIGFVRFFITFYKDTNDEIYNDKEKLKEEVIKEYHNNPEQIKGQFGIYSEKDITDEKLNELAKIAQRYRLIFVSFISLCISLVITIGIFVPVFIYLSVKKKYHRYRISDDEFKNNRDYYRDLLKGYTPMELSYNNNYQIDNYAAIATVLSLEDKKVLEYRDNRFYVLKYPNNLSDIEKIFLRGIGDDGTPCIEFSKIALLQSVIKSCEEKKLVELGKISKKGFFKDLIISLLVYGIIFYIWKKFDFVISDNLLAKSAVLTMIKPIILVILSLFIYVYPHYFILKYLILLFITSIRNYKRTEFGNDINSKLEGLKNYIRDFSILSEREKKEIVLWNDYLVYSVMFNKNEKIINEYKDKVKLLL